jgi:hypothetical protein
MIIFILIILILVYILNNNNTENFINFKIPSSGYWCNTIDCKYPTLAILKPNKINSKIMKKFNGSNRVMPYSNYNINPICHQCIFSQNNEDCLFFSIDSQSSILKYSKVLIEWFNFINVKELLKLILKKQFIYENNNLYFYKKKKNIKKILKPQHFQNQTSITIADTIIEHNNEKYVTIQFYIMLLIVYYKLDLIESKIEKKEKYNSKYSEKDSKYILSKIKNLTQELKFNKIDKNELYQEKLDEFFEKCNIENIPQDIPENEYLNKINIYYDQKNNYLINSIQHIYNEIEFKEEKKKFLLNNLNMKNLKKESNNKRKEIFKLDNLLNNLKSFDSDLYIHHENGIVYINNIEYIYSCGNLFTKSEDNMQKLLKCDTYGKLENYIPDKACIVPNINSYLGKVKNINLYDEIKTCDIIENEFEESCVNRSFIFNKNTLGKSLKKSC